MKFRRLGQMKSRGSQLPRSGYISHDLTDINKIINNCTSDSLIQINIPVQQ